MAHATSRHRFVQGFAPLWYCRMHKTKPSHPCAILLHHVSIFVSISPEIQARLDQLSGTLLPIVKLSERYSDQESNLTKNGTVEIFRRPWVAPLNFGLILYPRATEEFISKFNATHAVPIPKTYSDVLKEINGGFIFSMSLYGLPESIYSTGVLNRSVLQPLDLGSANSSWIREYRVDKSLFHFGGRSFSEEENAGYFFDNSNQILLIRINGEVLNSWNSFSLFLNDEIIVVETELLKAIPKNKAPRKG